MDLSDQRAIVARNFTLHLPVTVTGRDDQGRDLVFHSWCGENHPVIDGTVICPVMKAIVDLASGCDESAAVTQRERFRVGRHLGRTVYRQTGEGPDDADELIGVMDTPEWGRRVVEALNDVQAPREGIAADG